MTLERQELLGIAHAERERLGRTIQYAPTDAWDNDSPCAGWRNRDVMAHLAAQETAAAQLIGGEPAAEFDAFREANGGDLWVDGLNNWAVGLRAELPARQVIGDWGRAVDLFLLRASKLGSPEWDRTRVAWVAGDIGVKYLIQSRAIEWWLHGEDIREGSGLEANLQHWPIHLTCDLGVRMLPYSLGQAGLAFPGKSVRIDLEGMGEGSWHWGLAPRETPVEDKKPDAFIEGRAYAFALTAGRRLPGEASLDDGSLVVGGDEEIALAVLEHVHAYVE